MPRRRQRRCCRTVRFRRIQNLVTEAGLKALERLLAEAREAYETAQRIEDVNERRRQAAIPQRDVRYFSERVRTAQVVPAPVSTKAVAFGSKVTFERDDGRVQTYRIVGEDEADPKAGSISFASPVARSLMGKSGRRRRAVRRARARDQGDRVGTISSLESRSRASLARSPTKKPRKMPGLFVFQKVCREAISTGQRPGRRPSRSDS